MDVKSCYDCRRPLQSVSVPALIAAIAMLSSTVHAQSPAPWRAEVTAPHPGLPSVTIDFGYRGPYVPALNAPIVLRATASDVPFDGYIGYHFAVRENATLDTPVVARAKFRPHETWSFRTIATLRKSYVQNPQAPRQVDVEWRDRTMRVIASRSAGIPPWTWWDEGQMPLVVNGVDSREILGVKPYVESARNLPDYAQWYAGFSSVVIPVAAWLDLPEIIRQTIFGSGVPVVFVGFPRPDQHLGRLDQTLLPVVFTPRPGSYEAPWPYRSSRSTPLSWIAKDGADKIGSDQNPYIVRTNAATWTADEVAVARPLPVMTRIAGRRSMSVGSLELESGNWPEETRRLFLSRVAKNDFLGAYSSAIAAVAAVVVAIGGWILLRRTPRAVVAISVVLVAIVFFAERNRIRPPFAVHDYWVRAPVAPGIVDHYHVWRTYGPAPFAGTAQLPRTSITGDYGKHESAEIRTSETPPAMGLLHHYTDWDAVSRWSYERKLSSSAFNKSSTITGAAPDYHSPMWFWVVDPPARNGGWSRLGTRARRGSDGRGTCAFAIPKDARAASVSTSFNSREAELAWANGRTKLALSKSDPYRFPTAAIPPGVLREIMAHGGIVNVTFETAAVSPYNSVWIAIQEPKS